MISFISNKIKTKREKKGRTGGEGLYHLITFYRIYKQNKRKDFKFTNCSYSVNYSHTFDNVYTHTHTNVCHIRLNTIHSASSFFQSPPPFPLFLLPVSFLSTVGILPVLFETFKNGDFIDMNTIYDYFY